MNFSPYNYTLDNPINLIDPDGRLTIQADNTKDREALRRILKNIHDHVASLGKKSQELQALLSLSGFKTKKALLSFLTETRSGPSLTVDRVAYGNEQNGLDDGKGGTGSMGQMRPNKDPNKSSIAIDRGIVDAVKDGIESEMSGQSYGSFKGAPGFQSPGIMSTMNATLHFAGRILEHETVHWGAFYNLGQTGANDDVNIPLFGINLSFERGRLFESLAFGNIGQPFNPASNQSWSIANKYTQIQYTVTNDRSTLGPAEAMRAINSDLQMRALQYQLQKQQQ